MTTKQERTDCPEGWEETTHCGYRAFVKDFFTIYANPKGEGWIRVLIFKGDGTPTSQRVFRTAKEAAKGI